ncbi:sensor histidine kinase [Nocardia jejuensis]|uniref:sensor histidine kinase n=1 Tax=Nocardia jejuensis TaxID=328049 RepID=UPI00082AD84F|nr:histidine kinase [Nocardia jejuensis]
MNADTATAARLSGWQQCLRVVAAVLIGAIVWLITWVGTHGVAGPAATTWMITGDPIVAIACVPLVLWRRRYPVAIATAVVMLSTISAFASGLSLLALCSLATRRRLRETIPVSILAVLTGAITGKLYPTEAGDISIWYTLGLMLATVGALVAIGFAIGARREVVRTLRERAETAERAQHARAAEARIMERHRIAREMHDVLAHRMSVVAMYAGVLGFRTDLSSAEIAATAKAIAENSHEALEELRDILGVLRAQEILTGTTTPEPPQPTLAALPTLIADACDTGLEVTLTDTAGDGVPPASARTAYRIVQEGLTNARKHAPGACVRVLVSGSAGADLAITVHNDGITTVGAGGLATVRTGNTGAPGFPDSGYGLLGLAERTELIGGTLRYGPTPDGGFDLHAVLPWALSREQIRHGR